VLCGFVLRPKDQSLLVRRGGELVLTHLDESRQERKLLIRRGKSSVDAPVLDRHERPNLALAVDDQPERDGLDAPGRQRAAEPLRKARRKLVSDDPVQDAPGLLGVDQVEVDTSRFPERLLDGVLGDLGEGDPVRGPRVGSDRLGDVPRDGLALAVEVRGEPEALSLAECLLELADGVLFLLRDDVLGMEGVIQVHAHAVFGQVPDVALARGNGVVRPEISLQGLRLGRRFDDDELFWHIELFGSLGG
jgi:hypothetical protein